MIESEMRKYLLTRGAVTALVSDRIYPADKVPQGAALPRITYQLLGVNEVMSMEGASGTARSRIQVNAWATRKETVKALAAALRLVLLGFRGGLWGSTRVQGVFIPNQMDMAEKPTVANEAGVDRVIMDLLVWHEAEVPTFS